MPSDAAVLPDVVEEHLDESEFLIELWLAAARSPRFNLREIHRTVERRLLAHLDGLEVGGPSVADGLLWPTLLPDAGAIPSRVAAAASALLMDADGAVRDRLIEALRAIESPRVRTGLRLALQITARRDVDEPTRLALYATGTPVAQAALLAVLAARRVDPGPILGPLLDSADSAVLCAALAAAAAATTTDRGRFRSAIEAALSHAVPAVRAAALRTGLIWNIGAAWRACGAQARSGSPDAMLWLALIDPANALAPLTAALETAERRGALFALGFTGLRDAVELCLPLLDHPDQAVAGLAVEAIAGITGLPLYEAPFAVPSGGEGNGDDDDGDGALPPLADDLRADLQPVAIDLLPRPAAGAIRDWWGERRGSFAPAARYLRGAPLNAASLQAALTDGPLRRTGPLACEIAIRSGGRLQLPALRLAQEKPAVPADLVPLHRPPPWR
jgi:uncharacterized protein (TIGR02270 family)